MIREKIQRASTPPSLSGLVVLSHFLTIVYIYIYTYIPPTETMQSCTHQPYAYDMRKERTFPCGEKRSSSTFPKPRLGRSGGRAFHLCIGRGGRDEKNHRGGFLVHPVRRHYRLSSLSSCWWIELWRGERESTVGMTQSTSDSFDTCCSSLRVEYYIIHVVLLCC